MAVSVDRRHLKESVRHVVWPLCGMPFSTCPALSLALRISYLPDKLLVPRYTAYAYIKSIKHASEIFQTAIYSIITFICTYKFMASFKLRAPIRLTSLAAS